MFIIVFIAGCKKDAPVNDLVRSYTAIYTSNGTTTYDTVIYTYDAMNRRRTVQVLGDTPSIYTYSPGLLTITEGSRITTYYLNSEGQAVSSSLGYTYVYDSNGYLIGEFNPASNYYIYSVISNGNRVSEKTIQNGDTTNYVFTFLPAKNYRSFGQSFTGKANVNLANTEVVYSPTDTTTFTYSYTFDSEGRVHTATTTTSSSVNIQTYTYID